MFRAGHLMSSICSNLIGFRYFCNQNSPNHVITPISKKLNFNFSNNFDYGI